MRMILENTIVINLPYNVNSLKKKEGRTSITENPYAKHVS